MSNVYDERWAMVGASSKNTLIVCGGDDPVAIRVSHGDSLDLLRLIEDANAGIKSRKQSHVTEQR